MGPIDNIAPVIAVGLAFAAAIFDAITGKIPNALVYPAIAMSLILALPPLSPDPVATLIGGGVAFFFSVFLFYFTGLGGGDVKLLTALGFLLGWPLLIDVLILTYVSASLIVAVLIFTSVVARRPWPKTIRLGPPIAVGVCAVLIVPAPWSHPFSNGVW